MRRAVSSSKCWRLPEAGFVREYLERRGISERSIQTFEIGYSPPRDNRLLAHLTRAGYPSELIAQAGLARETDDGRYYDLFRGRLMIPIREWEARVAGFGSRALDEEATPKYLNTPRTPVFDKSRILYAMHLAKEPIRQHGAVIVEGYMDAIMAHQHGYDNVVASMGTALTDRQVDLVRRLTANVTMALDGDPAGRNATLRSLESSWGVFQHRNRQTPRFPCSNRPDAMELRVAELQRDRTRTISSERDPGAWPEFLAQAQELFDYLLDSLSGRADMDSPDGRSWVANTMLRFVNADSGRGAERSVRGPAGRPVGCKQRYAAPGVGRHQAAGLPESRGGNRFPRLLMKLHPRRYETTTPLRKLCWPSCLQHGTEPLENYATTPSEEWFSRSENREIYRSVISGEDDRENPVPPELQAHLESLRGRELRLSTQAKRDKGLAANEPGPGKGTSQ